MDRRRRDRLRARHAARLRERRLTGSKSLAGFEAGSGSDSGTAFVSLQDTQARGQPGFNGHSFSESFTSTGAADCDDEDQQGDCDEQGDEDD